MVTSFRNWWLTFRAANLPTAWSNVVLGAALSVDLWQAHDFQMLCWTALCITLIYLGGMAINDGGDVAFDRACGSNRPVARGTVGAKAALILGLAMLFTGWAAQLAVVVCCKDCWIDAGISVSALAVLVILYQLLHRRSATTALILMAGCRFCVPLLAATVLHDTVPVIVWWAAAAVACWTIGITATGRGERGGEQRLEIGGYWLSVASLGLFPIALTLQTPHWEAVGAGLLVLLAGWIPAVRRRCIMGRRSEAVCWAIAGLPVLDSAILLSAGHPEWAALCMVLAAITLGAQRYGRGS
ncbi:MAG: hypothetical protein MK077_08220 [Phycisphaerales bacterium]|nr:hypothetical protein [Phycisphaerales bacterium]